MVTYVKQIIMSTVVHVRSDLLQWYQVFYQYWSMPLAGSTFWLLCIVITQANFKGGSCLSCTPSKKCELTVIGHIATHAGMLSDFKDEGCAWNMVSQIGSYSFSILKNFSYRNSRLFPICSEPYFLMLLHKQTCVSPCTSTEVFENSWIWWQRRLPFSRRNSLLMTMLCLKSGRWVSKNRQRVPKIKYKCCHLLQI